MYSNNRNIDPLNFLKMRFSICGTFFSFGQLSSVPIHQKAFRKFFDQLDPSLGVCPSVLYRSAAGEWVRQEEGFAQTYLFRQRMLWWKRGREVKKTDGHFLNAAKLQKDRELFCQKLHFSLMNRFILIRTNEFLPRKLSLFSQPKFPEMMTDHGQKCDTKIQTRTLSTMNNWAHTHTSDLVVGQSLTE